MDNTIRDELRKAYNRQAAERDAAGIEDWKREVRENYLSLLEKEGKRTLLEIGSGPGRDGQYFRDNGLEVTCIDLSPEMVKLCQEKGLTAYVMDVCSMSFPENTFDSIYALNSMLHLTKSELPDALQSINSILTPSGLFYMGVYGGSDFEGVRENDWAEPKRFFSYYTKEGMRKVVSEVFEIHSFEQIRVREDPVVQFQSIVLRKKNG